MGLILGIGFFGLWFLSGSEIKIKNQSSAVSPELQTNENELDQFSDIGGKTPQETIGFLAGALEKNDLILAIKYFVPKNREVESQDLTKLHNINLLGDLIKDLKNLKNGKMVNSRHYLFEVLDETGGTTAEIELIKNEKGLWKVLSL
ncbi:MAG: hypothetical protein NTV77_00405 [Candidatus Azambacteria bacterium]|nr:hypothetical protein [Candidatus Azambacteria bacterium]